MSSQRHGQSQCDGTCTYRKLYEGSQASLSDMSSKQAGALNRVARLRSAIVGSLKQSFPGPFANAETQLAKRMESVEDEVLLAYLSGFLAVPAVSAAPAPAASAPPAAGLADLRDELEALGVSVPAGSDLTGWASAIASWSQARAAAARAAAAPAAQTPTESAAAPAAPVPDAVSATAPVPRAKASRPGRPAPSADPVVAGPDEDIPWGESDPDDGDDSSSLAELFDDSPAAARGTAASPQPAASVAPDLDINDLFGPSTDLSSLFDDGVLDDAAALVDVLFNDEPHHGPDSDTGEPAAIADARDDSATDTAQPTAPAPVTQPVPAAEQTQPSFLAVPVSPGLADQSRRSLRQALDGQSSPAAAATEPAPDADATPLKPARTSESVLRPELFPATTLPRGRNARRVAAKTPRVSVSGPDPRGLDVPVTEIELSGSELSEESFDKLVARVCIPRPVFLSDLVAQTGAEDLVRAWHQRCRDMGTESPLRFITPKPRHKARGELVVPHAPNLRKAMSEFTRSWWAECLDERADRPRLRGAQLYEVAVLLHRLGEQIISYDLSPEVLSLRVNQPRGLVGIVMALGADHGPGGSTRKLVAEAVGKLLNDRLTLLSVLTYSAGPGSLEKFASGLREDITAAGWTPSMPVVVSHSWDFAADGGSSALSVL